ncbi:MAG: YbbR-like domain-containing protein [Desulfovibrio sp.]|nr:YbbR-like domain-containing protein [Desulfovibrio sp.]
MKALQRDRAEAAAALSRGIAFLVAFAAAVGMWYFVCLSNRVETQLTITLNYVNMPDGLVVTSDLKDKVTVRLRTTTAMLNAMPEQRVTQLDLRGIRKGENVIPMTAERLRGADDRRTFRGFELIDISPPSLLITADRKIERRVMLKAVPDLPENVKAEIKGLAPAIVVLSGPEEEIKKNNPLIVRVPIDPMAPEGRIVDVKQLELNTPSLITAKPDKVDVRYQVTSHRKILVRTCKVQLPKQIADQYETDPAEVVLTVDLPEAKMKDRQYLEKLRVDLIPPEGLHPGESRRVRLHIDPPEGMAVLDASTKEVNVTKLR